jgi:hypothetical protein
VMPCPAPGLDWVDDAIGRVFCRFYGRENLAPPACSRFNSCRSWSRCGIWMTLPGVLEID